MDKPNIVTKEHLEYLDNLRESGVTNMYGVTPYLQNEFYLDKKDARSILMYWMKSFSERHLGKGGER